MNSCSKQIKEQIRDLKREMKNPSQNQDQELSKKRKMSDSEEDNDILKDFHEQQKKYLDIKRTLQRKGNGPSVSISFFFCLFVFVYLTSQSNFISYRHGPRD